ncbi:acetyl-CoA synthetase-like protein [Ramicandelaber brevisporus]|nr:acetyl-CoA synthetase-like protein [Ramicandelaber brevisporus]
MDTVTGSSDGLVAAGLQLDLLSFGLLALILLLSLAHFYASSSRQPDVHPLLLNNQADVAQTRYPGETAVYRSKIAPHGTELIGPVLPGLIHPSFARNAAASGGVYQKSILTTVDALFSNALRLLGNKSEKQVAVQYRPESPKKDEVAAPAASAAASAPATSASAPAPAAASNPAERPEPLDFINVSYQTLATQVASLTSTLDAWLHPTESTRLAILLDNTNAAEWIATFLACARLGVPVVPIFPSLSDANVIAVLKHTGASAIVISQDRITSNGGALAKQLSSLVQHVAIVTPQKASGPSGMLVLPIKELKSADQKLFSELVSGGSGVDEARALQVTASSVAVVHCLNVESGNVSSVALTHGNLVSAASAVTSTFPHDKRIGPDDKLLALTSLADPTLLVLVLVHLIQGASVAIARTEDAIDMFDDAYELSPTIIHAPTDAFHTLAATLRTQTEKMATAERKLFEWTFPGRLSALRNEGRLPSWFALGDFLFFRHYRSALGGATRVIFASGNAVHGPTAEYLRAMLACQVLPLFGPAASSGALSLGMFYDYSYNRCGEHMGAVLPSVQVKLIDDQVTNSTAEDEPNPRGQLCISGPSVVLPQNLSGKSADLEFTSDGYLKTNFLATFLPDRTIRILGTIGTSIIPANKNATEFIALERLENIYRDSNFVQQIVLTYPAKQQQQSRGLIATVYPRRYAVYSWAKDTNTAYNIKTIETNEKVIGRVKKDLDELAEKQSLMPYERIAELKLVGEPFSAKNQQLTVQLEVNRSHFK